MIPTENKTAEESISELQQSLTNGVLQIHSLKEQLKQAEENVKNIQSILGGVRLGQKFSKEKSEE